MTDYPSLTFGRCDIDTPHDSHPVGHLTCRGVWHGCPHDESAPHQINGSIARCVGYRRWQADTEWREHEGYPRDMTPEEEIAAFRAWDYNRRVRGTASHHSSGVAIDINASSATMRTARGKVDNSLRCGDAVSLDNQGRVVKAVPGMRRVGRLQQIDGTHAVIQMDTHPDEIRDRLSKGMVREGSVVGGDLNLGETYFQRGTRAAMKKTLKDMQDKDPLFQRLKKALGMKE